MTHATARPGSRSRRSGAGAGDSAPADSLVPAVRRHPIGRRRRAGAGHRHRRRPPARGRRATMMSPPPPTTCSSTRATPSTSPTRRSRRSSTSAGTPRRRCCPRSYRRPPGRRGPRRAAGGATRTTWPALVDETNERLPGVAGRGGGPGRPIVERRRAAPWPGGCSTRTRTPSSRPSPTRSSPAPPGAAGPGRRLAAALRITRFHVQNDFGDWDSSTTASPPPTPSTSALRRHPCPELLRGVVHVALPCTSTASSTCPPPACRLPRR